MQENFVRTSHLLNTPALRVALCRASVSGAFRSAPGPPLWCHNSHVSGCSGNINERIVRILNLVASQCIVYELLHTVMFICTKMCSRSGRVTEALAVRSRVDGSIDEGVAATLRRWHYQCRFR